jgi:hypothetical protein
MYTLGSAISIIPLYSMNSNGLDTDFSKALSNDFNRLGEKGRTVSIYQCRKKLANSMNNYYHSDKEV